jgi:hypothetical protein
LKTTSNVAIIATAALGGLTMLAVVALVALAPEDADLGLLIGLLLTGGGNLLATILNVGRTEQVRATVDELANGKMDAKIRAGVADVLPDHLVDPAARSQVEQDRVVRDRH